MENDNHTFLQLVRIPNAELWNSRDSDMVLSFEGDLQILHSKALNQFILRVQDFKVLLDKSVQVISSIVGRHHRQAFILPRGIGFSMIRLSEGKPGPALENLETIFENTVSFSRKSYVDHVLASFNEVREGGLTGSILKTFDAVSKVLAPAHDNESHPNQRMVRSFEELVDIDSHGTAIVDVTEADITFLQKKNELDTAGYKSGEVWQKFTEEAGNFSGGQSQLRGQPETKEQPEPREGHQRTSDMDRPAPNNEKPVDESSMKDVQTCRFHASIDHQEVVGAQEQRLPSYEVQHSKEHVERGLRKASVNMNQGGGPTEELEAEKVPENQELPEPEDFDDEAFTFGLLTKDHKQASNVGSDQSFPVSNEDAFVDLKHPMRKFSLVDRPFLNIDEESEPTKTEKPSKGGFTGQPIITAKAHPTLKSNIDDQPSPISSTEKYTTEPSQPEGSEQSSDAQPTKPALSIFGQQNIIKESSQGNETKKHKKISNEPVDKENVRAPTVV